jgi:hypothetical protein
MKYSAVARISFTATVVAITMWAMTDRIRAETPAERGAYLVNGIMNCGIAANGQQSPRDELSDLTPTITGPHWGRSPNPIRRTKLRMADTSRALVIACNATLRLARRDSATTRTDWARAV